MVGAGGPGPEGPGFEPRLRRARLFGYSPEDSYPGDRFISKHPPGGLGLWSMFFHALLTLTEPNLKKPQLKSMHVPHPFPVYLPARSAGAIDTRENVGLATPRQLV